ncbi:MAG: hypothetical protein ACKVS7_02330 [Gemmatimonadaceae bacterium]
MKIFVGYGYNERDRWIEEDAIPLIQSFDFEVVTGKNGHGEQLSRMVQDRIGRTRAIIGFATRRIQTQAGTWTTHRWVTDELAHASALGVPIVEVREAGVDPQLGLQDGRVHMCFTENDRERFLLKELPPLLQRWRRELSKVRLQLLPDSIQGKIIAVYRQPEFQCVYRVMHEAEERTPVPTKVVPMPGGLFVDIDGVPDGATVQIEVTHGGKSLVSRFESIDSVGVTLQGNWP